MRLGLQVRLFASIAAASAAIAVLSGTAALAQAPVCSVWLIESSRFMKVPFGAFMPDRAFVPGSTNPNNNIPTVDLPVNVGVIECGTDLILYDTGWKQQDYLKMTGSDHWASRPAIAAVGRRRIGLYPIAGSRRRRNGTRPE